jgi:hypothetical protein
VLCRSSYVGRGYINAEEVRSGIISVSASLSSYKFSFSLNSPAMRGVVYLAFGLSHHVANWYALVSGDSPVAVLYFRSGRNSQMARELGARRRSD